MIIFVLILFIYICVGFLLFNKQNKSILKKTFYVKNKEFFLNLKFFINKSLQRNNNFICSDNDVMLIKNKSLINANNYFKIIANCKQNIALNYYLRNNKMYCSAIKKGVVLNGEVYFNEQKLQGFTRIKNITKKTKTINVIYKVKLIFDKVIKQNKKIIYFKNNLKHELIISENIKSFNIKNGVATIVCKCNLKANETKQISFAYSLNKSTKLNLASFINNVYAHVLLNKVLQKQNYIFNANNYLYLIKKINYNFFNEVGFLPNQKIFLIKSNLLKLNQCINIVNKITSYLKTNIKIENKNIQALRVSSKLMLNALNINKPLNCLLREQKGDGVLTKTVNYEIMLNSLELIIKGANLQSKIFNLKNIFGETYWYCYTIKRKNDFIICNPLTPLKLYVLPKNGCFLAKTNIVASEVFLNFEIKSDCKVLNQAFLLAKTNLLTCYKAMFNFKSLMQILKEEFNKLNLKIHYKKQIELLIKNNKYVALYAYLIFYCFGLYCENEFVKASKVKVPSKWATLKVNNQTIIKQNSKNGFSLLYNGIVYNNITTLKVFKSDYKTFTL